MLAWRLTLFCLISIGLASGAPEVSTGVTFPKDAWLTAFARLEFSDLCQDSYVSKAMRAVAQQAITSLYGIRHNGILYLNYTQILHVLDKIMNDAREGAAVADFQKALEVLPEFLCIRSILKAQFGYCFKYHPYRLPNFCLNDESMLVLYDRRTVSVLPYFLDHDTKNPRWKHLFLGLVRLGRIDLLHHMKFPKFKFDKFHLLMHASIPEAVRRAVVESLEGNEREAKKASTLILAVMKPQAAKLPNHGSEPLSLLPYVHAMGASISKRFKFDNGLEESAASFWTHLLAEKLEKVKALLETAIKHGDNDTRALARVFYGAPISCRVTGFS